jgi:LysM repeat protein
MHRRQRRQLVHFGAPALFLLSITIVVLIIHGGFGGGEKATTTTRAASTSVTTAVTTSAKPTKPRVYTIKSGDTLGAIAYRFGVTVDDIMALNPGIDPNSLRVGQKIKVGKAPRQK